MNYTYSLNRKDAQNDIEHKYGLVIGISDYKAIDSLQYANNDANEWYSFLHSQGYETWVYGDTSSYYLKYNELATEYNIKHAISQLISITNTYDTIAFTFSGHGGSLGNTYYLCMWDCGAGENGEDGYLTDADFTSLWKNTRSKVFIFLDSCNSGGMKSITQNVNFKNFYMTTACGNKGYAYEYDGYKSGKWTYWFLEQGLKRQEFTIMEDCYKWAVAQYKMKSEVKEEDMPREFDGTHNKKFTL